MSDVEKYENMIGELERKREACTLRGRALSDERASIALEAHTSGAGSKAAKRLLEINAALAVRSSEIESIDVALKAAGEKLAAAERDAAAAADRAQAAEARKLAKELGECFVFLDGRLKDAADALVAISRGTDELRRKGFTVPSDIMLRIAIVAIIETWAHRLPPSWHNALRDEFRYLAPAQRKTALQYWEAILPSLSNSIRQRTGEAERTDTEAA
jgi:hypothetical protein